MTDAAPTFAPLRQKIENRLASGEDLQAWSELTGLQTMTAIIIPCLTSPQDARIHGWLWQTMRFMDTCARAMSTMHALSPGTTDAFVKLVTPYLNKSVHDLRVATIKHQNTSEQHATKAVVGAAVAALCGRVNQWWRTHPPFSVDDESRKMLNAMQAVHKDSKAPSISKKLFKMAAGVLAQIEQFLKLLNSCHAALSRALAFQEWKLRAPTPTYYIPVDCANGSCAWLTMPYDVRQTSLKDCDLADVPSLAEQIDTLTEFAQDAPQRIYLAWHGRAQGFEVQMAAPEDADSQCIFDRILAPAKVYSHAERLFYEGWNDYERLVDILRSDDAAAAAKRAALVSSVGFSPDELYRLRGVARATTAHDDGANGKARMVAMSPSGNDTEMQLPAGSESLCMLAAVCAKKDRLP